MHGNSSALIGLLITFAFLLIVDLYAWKAIQSAIFNAEVSTRKLIRNIYWVVSISVYVTAFVIMFVLFILRIRDGVTYPFFFAMAGIFFLFFVPKLVIVLFHIVEDVFYGFAWLWSKISSAPTQEVSGETIGRARFLSQLGLLLSAIPFGGILYGITKGRSAFAVEEVDIVSSRIPKGFDGMRIVQISDMHLGSLTKDNPLVDKGIDLIRSISPDMILFTGDIVNDLAKEMEPWIQKLSALSAPFGMFSVLGNHDYSDYHRWESVESKTENFRKLLAQQKEIGFDVLMDDHRVINRNGDEIALVGVQNFGRGFQQYGDLTKALSGTRTDQFKILMSHDPSHWDLEIRNTDVDLTLSGHTHGMQMGVKIGDKRYSPVSMIYKQWAGLYEKGKQMLYVNRGFGYIGFPGRVGMPPEITVLTLRSQA